ncbi:MAG: hypothetical protein M5U22_17065 [Thermoleophilia bacterium]|nr:hypothetical protein [Thermoleophilia bacterium]
MSWRPQLALVDLGSGSVTHERLDEDQHRTSIGGFGLNVSLAERFLPPGTDALSPENPIIVGSTPFAGTPVPGAARLSVVTRLPLNGAVAGCNGSMAFSSQMRWSGVDHLVIIGKADRPNYVLISEEGIEILEAEDLWGLDTYEATEVLWQRYGRASSVITMGMLGERLAPISLAFVDKAATAGKGGLGAVMGSKNLKAVVAVGGAPVEVAEPKALRRALVELSREMQADGAKDRMIDLATMAGWEKRGKLGFPYQNWSRLFDKERATALYGPVAYSREVKLARAACLGCTLPDKEILKLPGGPSKVSGGCEGFTYASSFSGRAVNYGIRAGVGSAAHVIAAHDAANRQSICDHHWSAGLDLAFDLRARGVIGEDWRGASLLAPGFESSMKLLEMTASGEGIGQVLARGIPGLLEEFGEEAEKRAIHIQGMDTVFDPRAEGLGTKELAQVVSPRRHWISGYTDPYRSGMAPLELRLAGQAIGLPPDSVERILPRPSEYHVGRMLPHVENWYMVLSSVGVCTRAVSRYYSPARVATLLTAITGIHWTPEGLLQAGARAWDRLRLLNAREGLGRRQDRFPARWVREPILGSSGEEHYIHDVGPERRRLDADALSSVLDDYYRERGWDVTAGLPSPAAPPDRSERR